MKHHSLRSIALAAMFALTVCIAGTVTPAHAQAPHCCTYIVDAAGVAPCCYPITTTILWNNGFTQSFTVANDGLFTDNVVGTCPPAPQLIVVSINGAPPIGLGQTVQYTDPNTGCCLEATVKLDAGGCLYIAHRPCPAPPVP